MKRKILVISLFAFGLLVIVGAIYKRQREKEPVDFATALLRGMVKSLSERKDQLQDDPHMIKAQRLLNRMTIEAAYSSLFDSLSLSDERVEGLKELLTKKRLELELGSDVEVQEVVATERRKKQLDSIENEIKIFLQPQQYNLYRQWEKTEEERIQVHLWNYQLEVSGMKLTNEQEYELIKLMYKERSQLPFPINRSSDEDRLRILTKKERARLGRQRSELKDRTLESANEILTEEQINELKKLEESWKSFWDSIRG